MHAFFGRHEACAKRNLSLVVVQDDQVQEEPWQHEYAEEFTDDEKRAMGYREAFLGDDA